MYWTNKRLEDLAKNVRMSFEDTKSKPRKIERNGKKMTVFYEKSSITFNFRSGTYLYAGKDTVGYAAIPMGYKRK